MDTGRLLFALPAGRRTDGKRLTDAMITYHLHMSSLRCTVQYVFGLRGGNVNVNVCCLLPLWENALGQSSKSLLLLLPASLPLQSIYTYSVHFSC